MKTVNRKNFNIVTLLTEVLFETLAFRLHKEGIAQALCQVQLSLVREEAANNKQIQPDQSTTKWDKRKKKYYGVKTFLKRQDLMK